MKDLTHYNNISRYFAVLVLLLAMSFSGKAQDGEALFTTHCKACHTTTAQRLVGPGMKGVSQKRTTEWLKSWVTNSAAMIASGDADAIAIFEEYSKIPMNSFEHLPDTDINALVDYLVSLDAAPAEGAVVEKEELPAVKVEYSAENIEAGKKLFEGTTRFANGGPSCLSCHQIENADVFAGGKLAIKTLTQVYGRLGDEGIAAILGAPPFPAMATSFKDNKLTEEEILNLTAFFKSVNVAEPVQAKYDGVLLPFGLIGFVIWLVVVYLLWSGRKKESVKDSIFKRQLKPIN